MLRPLTERHDPGSPRGDPLARPRVRSRGLRPRNAAYLIVAVTATITSGFVARAQRETRSDAESELLAEIRELRAHVDELADRLETVSVPPPLGSRLERSGSP